MVAGSEIAVQDRKSIAPAITAIHDGIRATIKNPASERRLNISRERFAPIRSDRKPPRSE